MEEQEKRGFHIYIRGIILIGFAMLLFKLLVTGHITNFIAPRMIKLIYVATIVSLLLGCLQVWRSGNEKVKACHCCEGHGFPKTKIGTCFLYGLFLIPIISAFLFSSVAIDGSVAAKRGMNQSTQTKIQKENEDWKSLLVDEEERPIANVPSSQKPSEDLEKDFLKKKSIQINDTNYIAAMDIIGRDVLGFKGKEVTYSGFVYHDKEVEGNNVVVARYGITCCVADATVWGMIASGEGITELQDETWVTITGILDETTYRGALFPLVKVNKVEKIAAPKQPYVYEQLIP
ncbi:Putative two-component membrane permease complex subunit SMU_746c [Bacillus rhizoplanae]|uniref:Two-component membrane permease complex subunit SMU_746c n=1 Tax=Bacillus rhizoplanae TaxID=2880966 RepID=A0ABN7ZWB3_9BACI|nr:TIGR03943 family protein [Bacillus rhizoplanae]CAG9611895.1 Putative two-component membrane permease complex subunit SMU_746c [Bacillus rhizoplanae]